MKPLLLLALAVGCTSTRDDPYASSLTVACDHCLSGTDDGGAPDASCSAELRACEAAGSCEQYIVCQLRAQCYATEPSGACEGRAGCELDDGDEAGASAARAFEQCARTTCAEACEFTPPS